MREAGLKPNRALVVAALGTSQTLAWASSFYLPAILGVPITGMPLIAGFASTAGWPASAWFEHAFGWREACFIWAGLNFFVALPLNWFVIPAAEPLPPPTPATGGAEQLEPPRGAMPVLAFFFCATRFVS